jgi:hypothetical protein
LFDFTGLIEKHNPCLPVVPVGWLVLNSGIANAKIETARWNNIRAGENMIVKIFFPGRGQRAGCVPRNPNCGAQIQARH